MRTFRFLSLVLLFSPFFVSTEVISQSKFEVGVHFDPLVIPVNFGTYFESGPGFYDINGRGKINQAGAVYFNYWPFKNFGFAAGVGIRNFHSQIDYSIPDPIGDSYYPIIEGSYPFSANGWGPSLAVLWRPKKWTAKIGIGLYDLSNQQYTSSAGSISVSTWDSGGKKISEISLYEEAYWYTVPQSYTFLQLECQYYFMDNFYVKLGFETTLSSQYPYPYKVQISGYTPATTPVDQVLNNYVMRNSLSSFSIGVGYALGFGKYKIE